MSDRMKTNVLLCVMVVFLFLSIPIQYHNAEAANDELTTRNAYVFLMPLVELYAEANLVTGETKTIHSKIFRKYIENINDHKLSLPLRPFALAAKKIDVTELERIYDKVENEVSKKEYQAAIKKLFDELKQFLNKENILSRDVPDGRCKEEVAKKLDEAHTKTLEYISGIDTSDDSKIEESLKKAEEICLANRVAASYSFLASYTYENFFVNNESLNQFKADIDRTIHYNKVLSDSLPAKYQENRDNLDQYTHSELRRRKVVQALIEDDMQKAQEVLLAAMKVVVQVARMRK